MEKVIGVLGEVFEALKSSADEKHVSLSAEGEGTVFGVRHLIFETLYNLCDNAVKYNCEGGAVDVKISENAAATVLCVSDTGIGIPEEHLPRIFERFYRVDKSIPKNRAARGLGFR